MTEWVRSYTPLRIKEANLARKSLPKYMEKHGRKTLIKLSPIPDDRQVKRPVSAFLWFCKERIASGEYEGLSFQEMTDRNRSAWENSTESEKQVRLTIFSLSLSLSLSPLTKLGLIYMN